MKYLVFAAATLIAGSALAGESMATKSFESLDKNADGHISVSESVADKTLSAAFATASNAANPGLQIGPGGSPR